MCDVTAETPVRTLKFSTLRKLSDLLDPQGTWRTVMMDINKPTGEPRYTQLHVRYSHSHHRLTCVEPDVSKYTFEVCLKVHE